MQVITYLPLFAYWNILLLKPPWFFFFLILFWPFLIYVVIKKTDLKKFQQN